MGALAAGAGREELSRERALDGEETRWRGARDGGWTEDGLGLWSDLYIEN